MNRLAHESSPYLRQHAENPVDWFPWGDEAFAKAAAEDKPVFLSIGYASCHWCHVMAHESFEDETVAKLMNEAFVSVKVDREERPDIDAIYMEATQAMTGQGGWPMSVFLLPDGKPFFAGTYFGKQSMPGHPSFVELIGAVDNAWTQQRDELTEQAGNLTEAVRARTYAQASATDIVSHGQEWVAGAATALADAHDSAWGGFGPAPKFPNSAALELLMRRRDPELLPVVTNTLDAMASGGIYDHLGGGFHRYSVDAFWMVPHFEKMLYDQAQLARTYTDAYLVTGEQRYEQVATETIDYVLRDLAAPQGGWYGSEDADSEGEEGTFYVWRPEAIDDVLGDQAASFKQWYGVTAAGNFEGSNILHRPERGDLVRNEPLEAARRKLLAARSQRVRPGIDDKVVTEWNAMFISTLAYASGALQRPDYLEAAVIGANFLVQELRADKGRWLRVWHRNAGAKQSAMANDLAWLVDAFTRLSEATGHAQWRTQALEAAEQMMTYHWDSEGGGVFTVSSDTEQLIVRAKELFDSATPAANSVAALALVRLGRLTDRTDLTARAEQIVSLVTDAIAGHPTAFPYLLTSVDLLSSPSTEVVIAGDHGALVDAVRWSYLPKSVLAWGQPDESTLWQGRSNGAYVCQNYTCQMPTLDPAELLKQLSNG